MVVECETGDIEKAFRRLMLTHHPDKGGDVESSKILNHAHDVLQDADGRRKYDEHGLEIVKKRPREHN